MSTRINAELPIEFAAESLVLTKYWTYDRQHVCAFVPLKSRLGHVWLKADEVARLIFPEQQPVPCVHCGRVPDIDFNVGYSIACRDCYDYAPDQKGRNECASALNRDQAIDAWNEMQAEIAEEEAHCATCNEERTACRCGQAEYQGDGTAPEGLR